MAGGVISHKRNTTIQPRTKVKTGCGTCRIRKVKCDEKKPLCQRCVSTGRTCDGYKTVFRIIPSQQAVIRADVGGIKSDLRLQPIRSTFMDIGPLDFGLLNHYFSTKTMFNLKVDCEEEARQILEASLNDTPIRHAISSLRALREDLETSGDGPASAARQRPGFYYGLQQYNTALKGIASKLSSPSSNKLRSALLCCQIFISIEQVRKNYAAMAQHIIQGLRIMHEYRARPYFATPQNLMPAQYDQLPFLDVFIIKLFAAPCGFQDPPTTVDNGGTISRYSSSPHQQNPVGSCDLRMIAPNMRTELTRIASSTLEFLSKVSQVGSMGVAFGLLSEKAALLDSLESWLVRLELTQVETVSESISTSFLRLFYLILKIVLLGALNSSSDLDTALQVENERLQILANNVGERVKNYTTCNGTGIGRAERSAAC